MHEVTLLINIAVALVAAFFGGLAARRVKLPTIVGYTLAEADLRARTGASVVAIARGGVLLANPKSMTVFEPQDRVGLIGERAQIEAAAQLIAERRPDKSEAAS